MNSERDDHGAGRFIELALRFPEHSLDPCAGFWVTHEGDRMGAVAFHEWVPAYGRVQVSWVGLDARWLIDRALWTEMVDWPFRELKVTKLWSSICARNVRARRAAEHLGFKPEAALPRHNGEHDMLIFSIIRPKE